ncbi:MAG: alpha/beta hydrolase [Alphaproteobacteria bacterium]|nr:alpha/beta hydrolase [Alphaproteobacteria bacterium]MBE8219770.1 alpha/beta hydrolase [Alphaproteobacteria bacterium]
MNIQKILLGLLKRLPSFVIRRMAGVPLEIDGNVLDPHIHLLARQAEKQEIDFSDILQARKNINEMMSVLNAGRRAGVSVSDTTIKGEGSTLGIRIYTPTIKGKMKKTLPAVLFFHQGGLVVMDVDSNDTFCTIMADICGACVISLDYRLCPEHKFLDTHADAKTLWDYVQANAEALAIDASRVGVAGDSAGGLLASVLCQRLQEAGGTQPKAQLLVYPWVSTSFRAQDGAYEGSMASCAECFPLDSATMEFFTAQVFPNDEGIEHPFANPLARENLAGLPSAIVATAGFDPIRDQGNQYAKRLSAAGVSVTHYCFGSLSHSFLSMGNVSHATTEASEQLARDLAALL